MPVQEALAEEEAAQQGAAGEEHAAHSMTKLNINTAVQVGNAGSCDTGLTNGMPAGFIIFLASLLLSLCPCSLLTAPHPRSSVS